MNGYWYFEKDYHMNYELFSNQMDECEKQIRKDLNDK